MIRAPRAAPPRAIIDSLTGYRLAFAAARGEVAQLVEHTTENRSVGSSILPLATNHALWEHTTIG